MSLVFENALLLRVLRLDMFQESRKQEERILWQCWILFASENIKIGDGVKQERNVGIREAREEENS